MDKIDTLIKSGLVFDGTGAEPFKADIGIYSDKIILVDRKAKVKADSIIDAKNMAVAPGFIDTHSHSEFTLLADPRAEGKVCQGITTEINGNCGLSAVPLYGEALHQRETDMEEFDIRERWSTFHEYFRLLKKKGIALNFVTLAGHGNIRASVIGYKDKPLDDIETKKMQTFLKKAISEGAIGLSTGLIYPPGVYSETGELIEMARCCNKLVYTTHMRSEGDKLIESIEETIRIGREARIRVHISHLKTSGKENWHKVGRVIDLMEEAREGGVSLTCDAYPYTSSSTDLDTILPPWTYSGGREGELKRLKNARIRKKIKDKILVTHPLKDYWKRISISSVSTDKNKWMEGRSLHSIAGIKGKEPVEILFDILIEERLMVSAIFASMHEGNLKKFLSLPYCMIGTDSSARSFSGATYKGKPHPRGFGTFPRFLGKYVRDENLMRLNEGIHKVTMFPAQTFGIRERGIIRRGTYADLVIFDPKKIIDRATFKNPFFKSEGIHYVFINGVPALWEGQLTNSKSGKILRHGR